MIRVGLVPDALRACLPEMAALLLGAAQFDDDIREVCKSQDKDGFLKLVAEFQHRVHALAIGKVRAAPQNCVRHGLASFLITRLPTLAFLQMFMFGGGNGSLA